LGKKGKQKVQPVTFMGEKKWQKVGRSAREFVPPQADKVLLQDDRKVKKLGKKKKLLSLTGRRALKIVARLVKSAPNSQLGAEA